MSNAGVCQVILDNLADCDFESLRRCRFNQEEGVCKMKVYLIMEDEFIRLATSTKELAESICAGWPYISFKIIEMDIIGEYHASR